MLAYLASQYRFRRKALLLRTKEHDLEIVNRFKSLSSLIFDQNGQTLCILSINWEPFSCEIVINIHQSALQQNKLDSMFSSLYLTVLT